MAGRASSRRVTDPAERRRVAGLVEERLEESAADRAREYFSDTHTGRHIGRSIGEIAAERGRSIGETALAAARGGVSGGPPRVPARHERRGVRGARPADARPSRAFSVASDGIYHGARPHPRGYGCYARILRLYVRELGAIDLPRAIHLMSGGPAARFRIRDRGRDRRGSRRGPGRARPGHDRRRRHLGLAASASRAASTRSSSTVRPGRRARPPDRRLPGRVVRGHAHCTMYIVDNAAASARTAAPRSRPA